MDYILIPKRYGGQTQKWQCQFHRKKKKNAKVSYPFLFFFFFLGTGTHFFSVSLIFLAVLIGKQKKNKIKGTVSNFYLFIFPLHNHLHAHNKTHKSLGPICWVMGVSLFSLKYIFVSHHVQSPISLNFILFLFIKKYFC